MISSSLLPRCDAPFPPTRGVSPRSTPIPVRSACASSGVGIQPKEVPIEAGDELTATVFAYPGTGGEAGYFQIAYAEVTGTSRFGYSVLVYDGYAGVPPPPDTASNAVAYSSASTLKSAPPMLLVHVAVLPVHFSL